MNNKSINGLVFETYESFKSKTALKICGVNRIVSFSELCADIQKIKEYFLRRKINGENIILVSENSYEWIVVALGIICSGNCLVPIDVELSDTEIGKQAHFAQGAVTICSKSLAGLFKNEERAVLISEMVAKAKEEKTEINNMATHKATTAMIVFTSGTTGIPKGVMISERNILAVIRGSLEKIASVGETFSMLPLNHTYSLMCGVLGTLAAGETVILNDKLRNFPKNMEKTRPAMLFAVPMVIEKMRSMMLDGIRQNGKEKSFKRALVLSRAFLKIGIDIRRRIFKNILASLGGNLKNVICGGAPLADELIAFFHDLGIDVLNGYGITECSPLVSVASNKLRRREKGVGSPISCCSVKIANPDKDGCGQILVKGDNVMLGYYKNPEATAKTIKNEWLETGDLGRIDSAGNLLIKGRIKNLILLDNGKNVYPEDIEELLNKNDYVEESIVYLGDKRQITAEIYTPFYPRHKNEINGWIKEVNNRLPFFAQIASIKYREKPFVKTTSKKIVRKVL